MTPPYPPKTPPKNKNNSHDTDTCTHTRHPMLIMHSPHHTHNHAYAPCIHHTNHTDTHTCNVHTCTHTTPCTAPLTCTTYTTHIAPTPHPHHTQHMHSNTTHYIYTTHTHTHRMTHPKRGGVGGGCMRGGERQTSTAEEIRREMLNLIEGFEKVGFQGCFERARV